MHAIFASSLMCNIKMPPTVSILVSRYRCNRQHPNILSSLLCTLVNIYSSLNCCDTVSQSEWFRTFLDRHLNFQGESVQQQFLFDWLTLKMDALHSFETSSKNRRSNPRRLESSATRIWKCQTLSVQFLHVTKLSPTVPLITLDIHVIIWVLFLP